MQQRIAVDATGGDHGPAVVVPGALAGARREGYGLTLVGVAKEVEPVLNKQDTTGVDVTIIDAPQVIGMEEHPAQAVRRKPNNSITLALREVDEERAAAMVSAGNSGAVLAASLLVLGRIPGVERPAIASYLPTQTSRTLVLDLGAVTDPKPSNLVQFAIMGQVYAERVLGHESPTIGLLSNGEEPGKGNQFVQQVFPMLESTPGINFIGNIEGKDILSGTVDIVVTDGFTGNVALKTAEGVASVLTSILREEFTATLPRKLAALVLRPALRAVRTRFDYAEVGGAPLLGVDGAAIIAHGRSNELAIENAFGVAVRSHEQGLAAGIGARIAATSDPTTASAD